MTSFPSQRLGREVSFSLSVLWVGFIYLFIAPFLGGESRVWWVSSLEPCPNVWNHPTWAGLCQQTKWIICTSIRAFPEHTISWMCPISEVSDSDAVARSQPAEVTAQHTCDTLDTVTPLLWPQALDKAGMRKALPDKSCMIRKTWFYKCFRLRQQRVRDSGTHHAAGWGAVFTWWKPR